TPNRVPATSRIGRSRTRNSAANSTRTPTTTRSGPAAGTSGRITASAPITSPGATSGCAPPLRRSPYTSACAASATAATRAANAQPPSHASASATGAATSPARMRWRRLLIADFRLRIADRSQKIRNPHSTIRDSSLLPRRLLILVLGHLERDVLDAGVEGGLGAGVVGVRGVEVGRHGGLLELGVGQRRLLDDLARGGLVLGRHHHVDRRHVAHVEVEGVVALREHDGGDVHLAEAVADEVGLEVGAAGEDGDPAFVGLGVVHASGFRSSASPEGRGCVWRGGAGSGGTGAASGAVPATASRRRRRATSTPTAAIRLTRPRYHGTVALSTAST